jgi:hypothetical protein
MLHTVALLTFPLVLTAWAYAEQPPRAGSGAEGGTGPSRARFTASADLSLAPADAGWTRDERGDIVVASADEAKPRSPAAPQQKVAPAEPQERYDVDVVVILSDAEVAAIDRSIRINKLKLTGPRVTNAALKDLHELALVNLLSIERTQITNAGLGLLEKTNLRSLRLWQRSFDDSALKQVKKLSKLESLDLEGTEAGGAELAGLKDLAELRTLVLGSATADAQVEALGTLSTLKELDLRGCRNLSDAGVLRLQSLTSLESIWLPRQATEEGELRLLQKLPKCKIQR